MIILCYQKQVLLQDFDAGMKRHVFGHEEVGHPFIVQSLDMLYKHSCLTEMNLFSLKCLRDKNLIGLLGDVLIAKITLKFLYLTLARPRGPLIYRPEQIPSFWGDYFKCFDVPFKMSLAVTSGNCNSSTLSVNLNLMEVLLNNFAWGKCAS